MSADSARTRIPRLQGAELSRAVADRTGYAFTDVVLLEQALTHSSVSGSSGNNERLEFLGDRVLSLVVADFLVRTFPAAREGELAVRLNELVRGETCAAVAGQLGLDELIRTDRAARVKGPKAKNILSDATEALIAAIYLDGGIDAARAFILRYWEPLSHAAHQIRRDAKTELQEWAARTSGGRPAYEIERREGPDHAPVFTVVVSLDGYEPARGAGRSRREAEQAAATALLTREAVWQAAEMDA